MCVVCNLTNQGYETAYLAVQNESADTVIVQVVTGWSLPFSVLIIGMVTVIYSSLGGIKTIVWIDSMQFLLYLAGGIISILFILFNSEDSLGKILDTISGQ